ncbi:MAG: hypothetical protein CSA81_00390 [Acidobacteria bacterium]|nr:MAG: hypothetical protein CSA81_00390 [Acidobacteriota bacterium]
MKNASKIILVMLLAFTLIFVGCGQQEQSKQSEAAETTAAPVTTTQAKAVQTTAAAPTTVAPTTTEVAAIYPGKAGKITVYISGPATMIEKLEQKFEAQRGDVIDIYHAGCGPLRQKVWAEAEANNLQADVFWGSNPLIYYMLDEKGLLDPYKSKQVDSFMPEYQLPDANFSLTNARYEVLVFNKQNLNKQTAPQAFGDLMDSQWLDKMAYTDLSQSSTAFALSTALWDMFGKKMTFFEGIKANNALIVPKSKTVADKIQSGEIEVGIVPHDAIFRLTKKAKKEGYESNLGFNWPKDGAIRLERPIAIIKNDARPPENQALAEEFVDFILSKEAQNLMLKFGFVSVRGDVEMVKGIPEDLKVTTVDWKEAGKSEQMIREDFKAIMSGN